jgi:hypothetical protein
MALWHEHDRGDRVEAERCLEAAMSADPGNTTAVRSLVLLHGQRGDFHRAAAYLTCAAGKTDGRCVEFAWTRRDLPRPTHDRPRWCSTCAYWRCRPTPGSGGVGGRSDRKMVLAFPLEDMAGA